jgi:hypothetical protein
MSVKSFGFLLWPAFGYYFSFITKKAPAARPAPKKKQGEISALAV